MGLQFLIDHGLRLADVALTNIGIHAETDTAFLFDLDALRRAEDSINAFVGKPGYAPPERKNLVWRPITGAEMVYECGVNLMLMSTKYEYPNLATKFMQQMIARYPKARPPMQEVVEVLAMCEEDSQEIL